MSDTTAKIRAKGLDTTGVTEDIANQMYAVKGRHYMAIVEMKVEELHEKADGTRKVDLVLTQVEPAVSDDMSEHLRDLTRTCFYNRGTSNGAQPTLTGHDEPTVEGVMTAGAKHRPHPFLPVDASQDDPICDVCGALEAAPIHSTQDTLPDGDDWSDADDWDEAEESGDDEAEDPDEEDEPDESDEDGADDEQWQTTTPDGVYDTDDTTSPVGHNPFTVV